MKKIFYLVIVLSLFLYCNILSANVVISGITSPTDMNGTYVEVGTWAGRPYFEKVVGMETYSLFYYSVMDPSAGWMLLRGPGQYSGGMWYPFGGYFLKSGSETFPPQSGYTIPPQMTMTPVTGDPLIVNAQPIPVSLWGVVLVFIIAGSILVTRHYRKRVKAA
jgi:hypothetical protein